MPTPNAAKESKNEGIKRDSRHLRGTIAEALADGSSHFSEENIQVLKFHGMYQQDDRDLRATARKEGREKFYSMMIRARIPGGVLTPEAYLQFDKLSDTYGNGTMRITTRQTFQLHGILKDVVKPTLQGIHEVLLTTLGGCGDQVRNIISCADPAQDALHQEIREDLLLLVDKLSAKTKAYHEIWLDGEKVEFDDEKSFEDEEPLYKETYLPRKFKLGFTVEGHNCSDVYANDLGIVAHKDGTGAHVAGYTLLVGGGMGRTPSDKDTYPRLGTPASFVTRDELVEVCTEIVKIQRDFGNRSERRYSRFKYLLDTNGLDWFTDELTRRLGRKLAPPRSLVWESAHDHLGWHSQGDGLYYLGIFVQNGRLADFANLPLKSVLRDIVEKYHPTVRLTTQQNLILCNLSAGDQAAIEQTLRSAGVKLLDKVTRTLEYSMACPALPTCGLATAESERVFPDVIASLEQLLSSLGLEKEAISIRMTGCSNGCARPYIADIGFVGRTPGKYDLFLGGDLMGARLNQLYKETVPIASFVDELKPILTRYTLERESNERFGDFCARLGMENLRPTQSDM